jgi:hypothetical protein
MADGFLVGESLLTRIKTTIDRVGDMPMAMGDGSIPTRVRGLSGTSIRMCKTIADWEVGSTQLVELWEYGDFPAEARNDPIQRFTAHNKLFRVKGGAFVHRKSRERPVVSDWRWPRH